MKHIYGLVDPRDRQIKYVGQSNDPERRYQQHINAIEDTAKGIWIQGLRTIGQLPEFILIDKCPDEDAFYLENWWILVGRRQGWPLTNGTNPGEWRAQEDFKQIFDSHLKAMEVEHKRTLEALETDAIRAARLSEATRWIGRTYFFPYAIIVCCCLFNTYATIARSPFFNVPVSTSVSVSMFWIIGLMMPYAHRTCRQMKEVDWLLEIGFWIMFFSNVMACLSFVYEMGAKWK